MCSNDANKAPCSSRWGFGTGHLISTLTRMRCANDQSCSQWTMWEEWGALRHIREILSWHLDKYGGVRTVPFRGWKSSEQHWASLIGFGEVIRCWYQTSCHLQSSCYNTASKVWLYIWKYSCVNRVKWVIVDKTVMFLFGERMVHYNAYCTALQCIASAVLRFLLTAIADATKRVNAMVIYVLVMFMCYVLFLLFHHDIYSPHLTVHCTQLDRAQFDTVWALFVLLCFKGPGTCNWSDEEVIWQVMIYIHYFKWTRVVGNRACLIKSPHCHWGTYHVSGKYFTASDAQLFNRWIRGLMDQSFSCKLGSATATD